MHEAPITSSCRIVHKLYAVEQPPILTTEMSSYEQKMFVPLNYIVNNKLSSSTI